MCVFGNTVASWIYLQPPLNAVEFTGVRVYDSLSLLRVILKQVSKLVVFWHQFVSTLTKSYMVSKAYSSSSKSVSRSQRFLI